MIVDRLYEAVKNKGHVCVGLDTAVEYIPEFILKETTSLEDAFFNYNKGIIDATLDVAACFKLQIAYYEALGLEGLRAYKRTLDYLKNKNVITIADIKRGDIAKTAEMYAKAHFQGDFEVDYVTLNPYMGLDGIQPYMTYFKNKNKGAFVLVRTSNKGAEDIQFKDTVENKKVYEVVGEKLNTLGRECLGQSGYSSIGGVVGCTHVEEAKKLRENLNTMFFLIPGYGAQGGTAEDVALYLKHGNGGVVNSSRGILLAYKKKEQGEKQFAAFAREEAIKMRDDILKAVKNTNQ